MDFITRLPEAEGSNALWVIMDRLTKIAHFVTCKDTIGLKDLAEGFITHIV
jgi:hypothetical protein